MGAPGEVEALFETVAPRYEEMVGQNGLPTNDMLRDHLTGPVEWALDLGAGTGLSTRVVQEAARPERMVAVDLSAAMLERLEQHNERPGLVVAHLAVERFLARVQDRINVAEVRRLASGANSMGSQTVGRPRVGQLMGQPFRFDLVTAMSLFHFLERPEAVIAGVGGLLRSGGQFFFTYDPFLPDHPPHDDRTPNYEVTIHRSTSEEIAAALGRSGLVLENSITFAPNPTRKPDYRNVFVAARKLSYSGMAAGWA